MVRQAACHQIAELLDTDFTAVVGLLKPHRPNKKMLAFVVAHFGLGDGDDCCCLFLRLVNAMIRFFQQRHS